MIRAKNSIAKFIQFGKEQLERKISHAKEEWSLERSKFEETIKTKNTQVEELTSQGLYQRLIIPKIPRYFLY